MAGAQRLAEPPQPAPARPRDGRGVGLLPDRCRSEGAGGCSSPSSRAAGGVTMGAAAHAWRLDLAQRDRPAREALGVGIGIGAGPRARLDLERVERHAGDNAAIFGSDVVGDDGLLTEGERDGTAAQFDDLDVSHGGHVSTGEAPVGRLRVCWCWSCTELRRTGPASPMASPADVHATSQTTSSGISRNSPSRCRGATASCWRAHSRTSTGRSTAPSGACWRPCPATPT